MCCRPLKPLIALFLIVTLSSALLGAETGHYTLGLGGVKSTCMPKAGLFARAYFVSYNASKVTNGSGEKLNLGFDVDVFAYAQRFIWATKLEFLGGHYSTNVVFPFVDSSVRIGSRSINDSHSGLGDIFVEPFTLCWHSPNWHTIFGCGFYLPTGSYELGRLANPGRNYSTMMITAGTTYTFGHQNNWSAAALSRFEFHGQNDDTQITAGNGASVEWAIARTKRAGENVWDLGLVGYSHWQLSNDSGAGVDYDASVHDKVHALGLEVRLSRPKAGHFFCLRHLEEFSAIDRSEGNTTTLVYTVRM